MSRHGGKPPPRRRSEQDEYHHSEVAARIREEDDAEDDSIRNDYLRKVLDEWIGYPTNDAMSDDAVAWIRWLDEVDGPRARIPSYKDDPKEAWGQGFLWARYAWWLCAELNQFEKPPFTLDERNRVLVPIRWPWLRMSREMAVRQRARNLPDLGDEHAREWLMGYIVAEYRRGLVDGVPPIPRRGEGRDEKIREDLAKKRRLHTAAAPRGEGRDQKTPTARGLERHLHLDAMLRHLKIVRGIPCDMQDPGGFDGMAAVCEATEYFKPAKEDKEKLERKIMGRSTLKKARERANAHFRSLPLSP